MDEERPEKGRIRQLWLDAIRDAAERAINGAGGPPLYLTLPGAQGLDIKTLVDAELVRLTETGAIAEEDAWKIVAVERSSRASLALRERWPGLRVLNQDISGVLASTGPLTWPKGDNELLCRAHVVNLDLNSSLLSERDDNGQLVFPTLQLIRKLSQLHLKAPALDWVLCLTIAADIHWDEEACRSVQSFLRENFDNEEQFATASRQLLGASLFNELLGEALIDMANLSGRDRQALLMVFVPKRIVTDTYREGWRIATTQNLRYGERASRMVSWLMWFALEPDISERPRAVYSDSLAKILECTGSIGTDGELATI